MTLDKIAHVETATESSSYGEVTRAWSKDRTVRLAWRPETPREQVRSGRIGSAQAGVAMIPRVDGESITSDQRISFDGQVWEVVGPPTLSFRNPVFVEITLQLNSDEAPA